MTAPATLLALADRIEKEEPSRELDEAIVAATGLAFTSITMPPPFTSSLDAAASLVPPHHFWNVRDTGAASVWDDTPDDPPLIGPKMSFAHKAKTPAMALCAAAIRALAQEQK